MSSPPHKPRFSRSPTPYTLDTDDDNKGIQGDSFSSRSAPQRSHSSSPAAGGFGTSNNTNDSAKNSFKASGTRTHTYSNNHSGNGIKDAAGQQLLPSSSSSLSLPAATTPPTGISIDNNDNNDHKKPTAGWTLFAALAKMTPEEVELIRLTKANTAANKLISASPAAVKGNSPMSTESSESTVTTMTTHSPTIDATLPNLLPRRSPSSQRQREMSLSPPSPPSPLALAEEGVSNRTSPDATYSHRDTSDKSPDARSPPPSTNGSERGSSPTSSSSSLSPVPSSFQLSPSPDSSPRRKKRSRLGLHLPSSTSITLPPSALSWSRKPKSPSSPSKSVQIDESKNMVFSYPSGSTIVAFLPLADGGFSWQDSPDYDQDDDHEDPIHKNDKTSVKHGRDVGASSASSSTSPWWPWTSVATSSPNSSQSGTFDNNTIQESSSLSPPQSWTPEAGGGSGSLDSTLGDSMNGANNTFMNIASSLDRLWSPPLLRRTFSEVSSGAGAGSNRRGSQSSSAVRSGPGGKESGGLPRIPILRRQASMPSLERELSEENPFLDPPIWSPAPSQSQESEQKTAEVVESNSPSSIPAIQELAPAAESEYQEVDMTEVQPEVQVNTPQALSASTTTTATTPTPSSKSSRSVIRRRDTRQSHHPYRRPVPSSNTSQDAALLSLPAQFRRAASFNGTTSTPVAQPVLRREASTTAYMDTL
ncbi:hypothetical protein BGW39_010905 [Mortierella sp. 14UC]|nr:hypothetical protein BGW39_010905 [Mortierella sp. 14UC]